LSQKKNLRSCRSEFRELAVEGDSKKVIDCDKKTSRVISSYS
jgi:hypothetical protein